LTPPFFPTFPPSRSKGFLYLFSFYSFFGEKRYSSGGEGIRSHSSRDRLGIPPWARTTTPLLKNSGEHFGHLVYLMPPTRFANDLGLRGRRLYVPLSSTIKLLVIYTALLPALFWSGASLFQDIKQPFVASPSPLVLLDEVMRAGKVADPQFLRFSGALF